jgi:hypothetical protein
MTGPLWWLLGVLCAAIAAAVGDMVNEEIRGRLDRVPMWLARQACRALPSPIRADRLEEWTAELAAILDRRGADKLPVTRLIVGIRFAVGLFAAVPRIHGRHRRAPRPLRAVAGFAAVAVAAVNVPLGNLVLLGLFAWLAWSIRRRWLPARHHLFVLLPMATIALSSLVQFVTLLPMAVHAATTSLLLIQPWFVVAHTARYRPVPVWLRSTAVLVALILIPLYAMMPRPLSFEAVAGVVVAVTVPTFVAGAHLLAMGRPGLVVGAAVSLLGLAVLALGLPTLLANPALTTPSRLFAVLAAVAVLRSTRTAEPVTAVSPV